MGTEPQFKSDELTDAIRDAFHAGYWKGWGDGGAAGLPYVDYEYDRYVEAQQ